MTYMQYGFTLLEVVVTITIITIITYLVFAAFSVTRNEQALLRAEQQLQNNLREAQSQALNEVRAPKCLDRVGPNLSEQRHCSNIGVSISGNTLTLFADISDDNLFSAADFQLETFELPANVIVQADRTFLFEATPPNITLYANGALVPSDSIGDVVLQAGNASLPLTISSYGHVDRSE